MRLVLLLYYLWFMLRPHGDMSLLFLSTTPQAASKNWQIVSANSGRSWTLPITIDFGNYNNTSVGPGRGLQLSDHAPAPGRILFIGHHGAYQVGGARDM